MPYLLIGKPQPVILFSFLNTAHLEMGLAVTEL